MKTLTCLMFALLTVCISCAVYAEEGLVLHYTFDEASGSVARDLSGKGNNGKIHGAKYVKMHEGYALEFDGVDDYVDAGTDASVAAITGDLTIEAWARKMRAGGDTSLVSTHYGNNDLTRPYDLLIFASDGDQPQFRMGNGSKQFNAASTKRLNISEWYHVVGVIKGHGLAIYVNGTRTGRATFSGTRQTGRRLTIGSSGLGKGRNFTGIIDEVKICSRALTEPEIIASFKSGGRKIRGWDADAVSQSAFGKVDTTPPALNLAMPPPDSTVTGTPTISAKFADAGSGIDVSSANILLDGKDVTSRAKVTSDGFTLRPKEPLAKGIHRVEVRVSDKAGNRGNRLAWCFGVDVPVSVVARFDNDKGLFLVNGEPFFPVGIYNVDTRPWRRGKPYLAQAAAAGINYQLVEETTGPELLDTMLGHGMKAMKQVHYATKALAEGDGSLMEKTLTTKDHPAILGWWSEYPNPTDEWIKNLTRTYQVLKANDPLHPVIYMISWPHAYKKCGAASDAYYVYYYPILNPTNKEDAVVSSYHRAIGPAFAAAAAEGKRKQVWFISQAFDYRLYPREGETVITPPTGFRPNPTELRAMNYQALTTGVKGLLFYASGSYDAETKEYNTLVCYPEPWNEVLKIAAELRYLAPALASGKPVKTARLEPDNPQIHYREFRHGDVHTLIAVNVADKPILARWLFARPVQPLVLFEDRALSEKVSEMTDTFKPLDVHVYQWKLTASEFAGLGVAVGIEKPNSTPKLKPLGKRARFDGASLAARAGVPPQVDGLLNDKCWEKAEAITDFVVYQADNELDPVQTQARIAFTRDALYVGIRCEEPSMGGLLQLCKKHDGAVWGDDSVELWFDTKNDRTSAYHLIINPLGTVYDEKLWDEEVADPKARAGAKKRVRRDDMKWNSGCLVKVHKGKDSWTIEARIPAKSMGIDAIASGNEWGFNIGRTRRSGFVCQMSSWTGVFTSPFAKFGTLRFAASTE